MNLKMIRNPNEESLLGLVEDDLSDASNYIDDIFNDLDLYEKSLTPQTK